MKPNLGSRWFTWRSRATKYREVEEYYKSAIDHLANAPPTYKAPPAAANRAKAIETLLSDIAPPFCWKLLVLPKGISRS